MSVIIRLQNLPWTANAADIRQFFNGLSIPEGGVHIVGGRLGDAFIAFSTDEDARQGMASDGGMLQDCRVKLFLSSRTEMQKIIEETRQQHLAMQQAAAGGISAAAPSSVGMQRPLGSNVGSFPPPAASTGNVNTVFNAAPGLALAANNSISFHLPANTNQGFPGSFDRRHGFDQHQHFENPQRMPTASGQFRPNSEEFPPHMSQRINYEEQQHVVREDHSHQMPAMSGPIEDPHPGQGGPYRPPFINDNEMPRAHPNAGPVMDRFPRDRRDGPPDAERNREADRGSFRGRDRGRRERDRDKERDTDVGRRGRRSRSRSGSRGRGRDRRRRSRSDSRERRRSSRDSREQERDRNSKLSKSGLLPTPADRTENEPQQNPHSDAKQLDSAPNTSVQLRLLTGDLTYRDIREYLDGIHIPNTCIKMINAFDGYRFGLAYIRFTSTQDKQMALSRHNGQIRGHPVHIIHVADSIFIQAIDSFSPGVDVDSKSLASSCLAMRDFPPVATAQTVKEAFGTISIGRVLPERNEIGTVTGLCYAEVSSEADGRKATQLLKDGVLICGRPVKVAFLPYEELLTCARNLERLRGVVGVPIARSGQIGSPLSPVAPVSTRVAAPTLIASGRQAPQFDDGVRPPNGKIAGSAGYVDPMISQRGPNMVPHRAMASPQRIFISGLPLSAMERDLGDFFSDVGVIPQTIEIMFDDDRMPMGQAYCQFASMQEAERALDKNGGFMGGHVVNVTLMDDFGALPVAGYPHLDEKLSLPNPYPDPGMDRVAEQNAEPRMYGANGPHDPYSRMPVRAPGSRPDSQMGSRFGGPRFGNDGLRFGNGGSPRFPTGASRGSYGGGSGPHPRPSMNMRVRPGGPPEFLSGMPNGGHGGFGGGGGRDDGSPTPGFGAPGCVVALANVPQKPD